MKPHILLIGILGLLFAVSTSRGDGSPIRHVGDSPPADDDATEPLETLDPEMDAKREDCQAEPDVASCDACCSRNHDNVDIPKCRSKRTRPAMVMCVEKATQTYDTCVALCSGKDGGPP